MNLRAIRALSLALSFACLVGAPLAAAPRANGVVGSVGKISGVVVDPAGTPQMGATVLISSESLLEDSTFQILTNDRGRFSTDSLPAGLYSLKVTLAGFLPTIQQHIKVDAQHATLLQIVLGSVLSSLEQLRRQPDQSVAADDWTWVLRTAAANRSVLRWKDTSTAIDDVDAGQSASTEGTGLQSMRGQVDLTSGSDHPGSVADLADAPGTAFAYDVGLNGAGRLLVAGQYSYNDVSSAAGLAGEWLPSGSLGTGSVTTVVMREARLGPVGPTFRGLRLSHDDQLALGDRVSLRYGAEYLMAGFNGTTSALRPHVEMALQMARAWQIAMTLATSPWDDTTATENALQSTIDALDALPTLMVRNGRPTFENGAHEELAVKRTLGANSSITAAVFHDLSTHTAVIGRGEGEGDEFLQDYFSPAFAYDGGISSSAGMRVAYDRRLSDNLTTTVVYAYAGALAPDGNSAANLRDELSTQYQHSLAGRVTTTVPRLGTKLTVGYKWLSGSAVSRQDPYGESLYQLDPYLSMQIRQPLPNIFSCHMEVHADMGNLLAQGYVPVAQGDGYVVLVPSYRFVRGGLSLQF